MSKSWLLMKYHPAKKEVEFRRYRTGTDGNTEEDVIRSDSRLQLYMNKKGKFVLQDHGNDFFSDIADTFDGLKTAEIKVITTKADYEDFEQMTEYYNEQAKGCKFTTTLLAELPDMASAFNEVRKFGENAVIVLKNHQSKLYADPSENEEVQESAQNFSKQIGQEITNIQEKINSLDDNNVSLCFTGVYTSGKSRLINTLLGFGILPEALKSETAKMYRISSPKKGSPVYISFGINDVFTKLEWNENEEVFEFSKAPSESEIRTEIQEVLNDLKEKKAKQHEQIKEILTNINVRKEISPEVRVAFPVPLDSEAVQFTIYDTPGADSNYLEHQAVLNDALAEQTQSILIFVVHPDKLEGEGNNALLNYLKAAEEKNTKTCIDIGRSIFVANYADKIEASDREKLRFSKIKDKEDDSFSINLSDKKLLYVTARYGYAAKAVQNGIATKNDLYYFEKCDDIISRSDENPIGPSFLQNHCATSERATEIMLDKCLTALDNATSAGDKASELLICSGIYALENEIKTYGEKYAASVKAYAIIDSVENALSRLSSRANSLRQRNIQDIETISKEIDTLKSTINKAIESERDAIVPKSNSINDEDKKKLGLDGVSLNDGLIGNTCSIVKRQLKHKFLSPYIRVNENDKENIRKTIRNQIDEFTNNYKKERKALLEKQRDQFIDSVKRSIIDQGGISDEAKKWVCEIPKPEIKEPDKISNLGEIYDSYKRTETILWIFSSERLDEDGFMDDIEKRLSDIAQNIGNDYGSDYMTALQSTLEMIKNEFETNLKDYSLNMKALIKNKEAMQELGNKVHLAAEELKTKQEDLNDIIWKELKK